MTTDMLLVLLLLCGVQVQPHSGALALQCWPALHGAPGPQEHHPRVLLHCAHRAHNSGGGDESSVEGNDHQIGILHAYPTHEGNGGPRTKVETTKRTNDLCARECPGACNRTT